MVALHTYLLAVGVGNIAFALLMVAYMRGVSAGPALQVWVWARLAFGTAQLLAWSRPQDSLPLLVTVELASWIVGLAFETAAYAIFFGYAAWRRYLVPLSGLALLLACAAPIAGLAPQQVIPVIALIMGVGAVLTGIILLHPRLNGATMLQALIGVNDVVFGAAMAVWAWMAVLGMSQPATVEAAAYIAGYMLMIVNGFGFMLLSKERDDARMERLATTDELTSVLNRRAFFSRAESARLLALRQRQPIALLMLDIDHFKQLNDRFGHATGDEALTLFARTTAGILREHDILGRMGGEEFALALPGTDLAGAMQAAERLRQATMEIRLLTCGNSYTMTVSIGLVVIEPNEDLPAALGRADRGLYAAKRNGRNRMEVGEAVRRVA